MTEIYLNLQGIPTLSREHAGEVYFFQNGLGEWILNTGTFIYDIDNICAHIHEKLAIKIYGSFEEFYKNLKITPEFIYTCGMNSESAVGKDEFERFINAHTDSAELNKALYLYDCRKLVSSIQEGNKEVWQILGEFYRVFNLEEIYQPKIDQPDGIRYISSPVTTHLNALLSFIFIRMHSLLDYLTKLTMEASKIKSNFQNYPRLASKNILFSAKKDLKKINKTGTVFEECEIIKEIETIRNHLIHDGLLDDLPKVYTLNINGECKEKYILMPDRNPDGRFSAFKNRNLFYSKEDKINLRLPLIIKEFQNRELKTLEQIKTILG